MSQRLFGALVFTSTDGAGLPPLEDTLPEVRNPLDLPLRRGSEADLRAVVGHTQEELQMAGMTIKSAEVKAKLGPAAMHPAFTALVVGDEP